jgi:hypothetical protein
VVKLVQYLNASDPISVTLFGMDMDVKDVPRNAPPPIMSTVFGMEIDVKLVQPANAPRPIIVRLLGDSNITVVRLVQFSNAPPAANPICSSWILIEVTLFGIVMEVNAVQP